MSDPGRNTAQGLIRTARQALTAGDTAAARSAMVKARPGATGNAALLVALGDLWARLGDQDAAIDAYRNALATAPGDAGPRIALGHALTDAGRADAALGVLAPFDGSAHADGLACLAGALLAAGQIARAVATARAARTRAPGHPAAWFLEGRALAAAHEDERAMVALDRAARLRPNTPPIEAERAQVAMRLGQLDTARAAWERVLQASPANDQALDGLAKLLWMTGKAEDIDALFARARAAKPDSPVIAYRHAQILARMGRAADACRVVTDAQDRGARHPPLQALMADLLREAGETGAARAYAQAAYDADPGDLGAALPLIRLSLHQGDPATALSICRHGLKRSPDDAVWRAWMLTAQKALGAPDYRRDAGYDDGISVADIAPPQGFRSIDAFNAALAERLMMLHTSQAHPLDQSLRHGTQTSVPLHRRDDPMIAAFFEAIRPVVDAHIASLRAKGPAAWTGQGWRVTGSWSVRLHPGGHHVDHIHDAWISSAYYVSLPDNLADQGGGAGHLRFGRPPLPVPGAAEPDFVVTPKPGRLVLFPSWLWHGTIPFAGPDARLTIAVDLAPRAET